MGHAMRRPAFSGVRESSACTLSLRCPECSQPLNEVTINGALCLSCRCGYIRETNYHEIVRERQGLPDPAGVAA